MRSGKISLPYKAIGCSVTLVVTVFLGYIVIQPLLADLHYRRAKQEYKSMRWKEAIIEYDKAISIQPHNAQYHLELARIYSRLAYLRQDRDALKKAIKEFRTALQLNPHDGLAHSHLGWTYRRHGMYEEAIQELKRAIELDPTNVSFHWRLGLVYEAKGQLTKAKKEFEKVLDVIPRQPQAQLALIQINKKLNGLKK